jgi:hypothetical protein
MSSISTTFAAVVRKLGISAILCLAAARSSAATIHVSPTGNDANDGTEAHPVATLTRARDLLRPHTDRVLMVHPGTYFLDAPLSLTAEDSGLAIVAAPGARPILSGGRLITGWKKTDSSVWTAPAGVPILSLRSGDSEQTLARTPNFDPADPIKGGWQFVARAPVVGEFGPGIGGIHTQGDWLEWKVTVPETGTYALWMRYAGQNAAYFGAGGFSGNSQIQVDGGEPVLLSSLPDTPAWDAFAWSRAAELPLTAGEHTLRWQNLKGGGINWDAFVLSSSPAWKPEGTALAGPQAGRLVVVQAEAFSAAGVKELVVSETKPLVYRDRFRFRPGDITPYPRSPEPRIHIFPAWGWVNTILQLNRIDPAKNEAWIKLNRSASEEIWPGNRYFISNIFEGLDQPGEWWQDRAASTLYWWPPDAASLQAPTIAAVLDRLITISGAKGIRIAGLEFRDTTYSLEIGVYSPNDAAIALQSSTECVIEGNRFIGLGGYALIIQAGSHRNEFIGNEVARAGQGGVLLEGSGDSRPDSNVIAGNTMRHLGLVYKHVAAAYGLTASRTRVAHNLIEHVPRYATSFKSLHPGEGSHLNVIEYNEIRHTNLETNDTGAIEFLGRDKELGGNVVQYNRILDSVGLKTTPEGKIISPYMTWAIYLDDYSSGVTIRGNIAARYEWGAVGLHAGKENLIENNIFVDGAIHQMWYAPRDAFAAGNRFLRNIVVYRGDAPDLIHRSDHAPSEPITRVLTESNHNIYWNTTDPAFRDNPALTPLGTYSQWQASGYDLDSLTVDPGFTAPTSDDFRLQPDSPASQIGFQPIPVEKIGPGGYGE